MDKRGSCSTCLYFYGEDWESIDKYLGECRYNPPAFYVVNDAGRLLLVTRYWWCGRYKEKRGEE